MKNDIILTHQHGLGDHFICNGLVNWFSQRHRVWLPTWDNHVHPNLATVTSLYSDNDNVIIVPIKNCLYAHDAEAYFSMLSIPFQEVQRQAADAVSEHSWYEHFYTQFGISYDLRYSLFSLPKVIPNSQSVFESVTHGIPYRLIHCSTSGGVQYNIEEGISGRDDLEDIYVDISVSANLLDWMDVIRGATEIHTVQSSVFWLIDSLKGQLAADLYYHEIRVNAYQVTVNELQRNNPQWNVIEYHKPC